EGYMSAALLLLSHDELTDLQHSPTRRSSDLPSPRVGFRLGLLEAIDQLGEVCAKLLERRRDTGRSFDARIVSTRGGAEQPRFQQDRKSTRLNSSHVKNSYAVFCAKKKST